MRAQSSWPMEKLLDEASSCCGVERSRLSIAKPPTVGSKALTQKLLAALKWDDPKLLACAKVGSYPLQLRDGDLVLLRDGEDAAKAGAAGGGAAAGSVSAGASKFPKRGGGGKFPSVVVAGWPSQSSML